MANFCLPKFAVDAFINSLPEDISELVDMTSAERRDFFAKSVGEANAKKVNALFESKLLLKNQQQGIINWAKSVANMNPETKRDILSKVDRMTEVLQPDEESRFLEDLAEKKLGFDVTAEEAGKLAELSKAVSEADKKIPVEENVQNDEYGAALEAFKTYVGSLKMEADKLTPKEYVQHPLKLLEKLGGLSKSLLTTLDNSFFGRQGIKVLFTTPDIWAKTFMQSWGDIAKALGGADPIHAVRARIFGSPNARNGKYNATGVALGLLSEEAFPEVLPAKIPVFGRIFTAAEAAYNGGALRMRAAMADRLIAQAEEFGVNTLDKEEAKGIGRLVNSMTGRGDIGKVESVGKPVNALFFSIRFLKSNFDTLYQGVKAVPEMGLDKLTGRERTAGERFARKKAATNLLKIAGGMGAILATANYLWPGSTDLDPRSSNFGKIKIGATTFDITGGMGSLVTLAARMTPTEHNGKLSFWTKNSKGQYVELGTGKFGAQSPVDVINNFWEGKLAPLPGLLRDLWVGQDFSGVQSYVPGMRAVPTPREVINTFAPLPGQTAQDLLSNPKSAPFVLAMIMEELGINTNTKAK